MTKLNIVVRSDEEIEDFVNNLDVDQVRTLIEMFGKIDRLEMVDGQPRWNDDEMDLIGVVQDFLIEDEE